MTKTYSVPEISCGHCKAAIEGELGNTVGVASASVDIQAKTVTVEGDATDEAIRTAIGEAGYTVEGAAR